MGNLAELQQNFQCYLMQQESSIQHDIANTPKISIPTRLAIYRDAYYLRLLEVLSFDYPGLHVLLGDDKFDQLGRSYIDAHPSQYRSVRWFGEHLPHFLQDTALYSQNNLLIEMAKFEWALVEAFDVSDVPCFPLTEMASISVEEWPELQFRLHPSVQRLAFEWNIAGIWNAMNEEEDPHLQKGDETTQWLIWRKGFNVQFCSLSVEEAYFIDALNAGQNFSQICEGLCEWVDEESVSMTAATLLKRFMIDELITERLSV